MRPGSSPSVLFIYAIGCALCACDEFEFEGFLDKEIPIELAQGIPTMPILVGGQGPLTAALDTGSPLTIVQGRGSGEKSTHEVRLQNAEHNTVSRFIFPRLEVFDLTLEPVGLDQPLRMDALLGASLLKHFSVNIRYGTRPTLTLSDKVPDTNRELADECDPSDLLRPDNLDVDACQAVFATPRVGGGLAEIGGEQVELSPSRLVVSMCLMPAAFDPRMPRDHGAEVTTGVPVMAVVATGLGTSVISRSAFERLRTIDDTLVAISGATLYLPYGTETVSMAQLERVAVISHETNELGPCGELALRRRLLVSGSVPLGEADQKLLDDKYVNGAGVALATAPIAFAVLEDDSPLLQGLRKEVQPAMAEVNVVLGGSFFEFFSVTVDYPGNRMLLRCAPDVDPQTCQVLPWCSRDSSVSPTCPGR